jgi:4-oxalomesaconate tautomerase
MRLVSPFSGLKATPCVWMRGGTSKAAFFHASDLPSDPARRDPLLLAALGSPDARQIDGIGGATPLTTKIAVVAPHQGERAEVDYLFGQLVIGEHRIDWAPTCGNILAAVGPFAIEQGLVPIQGDETRVRIRMVNTDALCVARVRTPDGRVQYSGATAISGVPGTAAPIELEFQDVAGSSCGALFPTGSVLDDFDGISATCVDNGMPVVVLRAADLGLGGYESPVELNANTSLKQRLESIRLQAGLRMGLGDVSRKVVPKLSLLAAARAGGDVCTRTFIPHQCHDAIGVLGAASVATACVTPGSVWPLQSDLASGPSHRDVSVEHPTGEFTVRLGVNDQGIDPSRLALLRTARPLFAGQVFTPV